MNSTASRGSMIKPATSRSYSLLGAALLLLAMSSCSSAGPNFRRFEVGPVPPEVVLENALDVVKNYYTQIHGGVTLIVDEENLRFETGYIQKRTLLEDTLTAGTADFSEQPSRQKLYFQVLPESSSVDVEILATYEIMYIKNPEDLEKEDDLWKLLKQDTIMEDLIHQKLLERLVEKQLLE